MYQCGDLECLVHILVSVKKSSRSPFNKSQPLYHYTEGPTKRRGSVVLQVIEDSTVHIYAYGQDREEPISFISVSMQ